MKFKEFITVILHENQQIESTLRKGFPEVRFVCEEDTVKFVLTVMLIQEKRRGQGEAKEFMKELIKLAKKYKKDIYLSASDAYGGDVNKLVKFYKSLGFREHSDKVPEDLKLSYKDI